ncbi:MAG: NADH-quinone oxidoreductase subunit A [Candidatus Binatia bacterium]
MYFHFGNVLVFLLLGLVLAAMMLGLGRLLRPANPEAAKLSSYECGEPATGSAWINFNIRFYLVALVFVVFDVELAFMYPVMAVFKSWVADGRGLFALGEILLFIGILAVGLVYVWAKRDLEWVKRMPVVVASPVVETRRAA